MIAAATAMCTPEFDCGRGTSGTASSLPPGWVAKSVLAGAGSSTVAQVFVADDEHEHEMRGRGTTATPLFKLDQTKGKVSWVWSCAGKSRDFGRLVLTLPESMFLGWLKWATCCSHRAG